MKNKKKNKEKTFINYGKLPSISVVVPCYNVSSYIDKCLDLLLEQSYSDLSIVVIDDCSTDSTKTHIKKYAEKYPKKIKAYYSKKNHGLGYTRNLGIKKAESEIIGFIDPDDWVPQNYFENLFLALESGNYDLATCDIFLRYDDENLDRRICAHAENNNKDFISPALSASAANKLFRKYVFSGLPFPEDIINEDVPVTMPILAKYKAVYSSDTYYNYYQRPTSIQNKEISIKRLDIFKAIKLTRQRLGKNYNSKIWEAIIYRQIIELMLNIIPKISKFSSRKKFIIVFSKKIFDNDIQITNNSYLNKEVKNGILLNIYSKSLIKAIINHKYTKATYITGIWSLISELRKHKVFNVAVFAIRHPRTFIKRIYSKLFSRNVIEKNINMEKVIKAAKYQSRRTDELTVSVIIPNYNYERFMYQRLYSILYQTKKIGEIIILDDVSSDNSVKLIKKIIKNISPYVDVRLIANIENKGTFRQWELGFNEAKYEFIWITEADDYSNKKFLEEVMKPFSNKDVVLSYSDTAFVDAHGSVLLKTIRPEIDTMKTGHWNSSFTTHGIDEAKKYSVVNNTIANVSSVVFRKIPNSDLSKMFDESRKYRQSGDWVFYINYFLLGDVSYVNKPLNYYRMHGNNVSSTTKYTDHFNEMQEIHSTFIKKLNLNKTIQKNIQNRQKFVKRVWGLEK